MLHYLNCPVARGAVAQFLPVPPGVFDWENLRWLLDVRGRTDDQCLGNFLVIDVVYHVFNAVRNRPEIRVGEALLARLKVLRVKHRNVTKLLKRLGTLAWH